MNEGNGEVEVGLVTADQGQAEEDTNGNDGTEVDTAVHRDLLPRVKNVGEAGQELRHQSRKGQVPCRQENSCAAVRKWTWGA